MPNSYKRYLLVTTAATTVLGGSAFAPVDAASDTANSVPLVLAAAGNDAPVSNSAGTQIAAADSVPGSPAVEQVTITALLREENLQRFPGAISVVTGDLLDTSDTVNPQSLTLLVPALY